MQVLSDWGGRKNSNTPVFTRDSHYFFHDSCKILALFYIDQNPEPVLVVEDMKHGAGEKGSVGIFVDIGTEAFVSELKVTCTD